MAARGPLDNEHHVMRFVPLSGQHRDESDVFLGISPQSLELRPSETGLSVTRVEHFGSFGHGAKVQAAIAFRNSLSSKRLGAKGVFATAKVQNILSAGVLYHKKVRVVHDPTLENPGHAEVRHLPNDDIELLDFLASAVFNDFDFVGDLKLP